VVNELLKFRCRTVAVMNKELAVTSQQYGFLAGIFFFGYSIFEIPSSLLLHKVGARIWIARILVNWGILVVLTRKPRRQDFLQLLQSRILCRGLFQDGDIGVDTLQEGEERQDAARSQVIDALEAQEIKETGNEEG
jgi:hypothetical protein